MTDAEPDTMHQTSVAQSSGLHSFSAYVEQFRSVLHPKSQLETLYIIYSWMSSLVSQSSWYDLKDTNNVHARCQAMDAVCTSRLGISAHTNLPILLLIVFYSL